MGKVRDRWGEILGRLAFEVLFLWAGFGLVVAGVVAGVLRQERSGAVLIATGAILLAIGALIVAYKQVKRREEAEEAGNDAERRYRLLLEGHLEVGPGLRLVGEIPRRSTYANMDPITQAAFDRMRLPIEGAVAVVELLVDLEDARVYVWADAPIYEAHGHVRWVEDGEARAQLLLPRSRRSRWVELCGPAPLKAGQRVEITLKSHQGVALRRVALEPEPVPLDLPPGRSGTPPQGHHRMASPAPDEQG